MFKYSESGDLMWFTNYNGPSNMNNDYGYDLCIDGIGNIYATGISRNITNTNWDAVTLKYSQPIGIVNNNNQFPTKNELWQNYPNPFNSTTIISYAITRKVNVKLSIYNITGQLISTIVNTEQDSGYYSIAYNFENLSSGIYFYSLLINGVNLSTKKLVLVK